MNYTDVSPFLHCTNNKRLLLNDSKGFEFTKILKELLKFFRLLAAMSFGKNLTLSMIDVFKSDSSQWLSDYVLQVL